MKLRKSFILGLLLVIGGQLRAQPKVENLIVITTDGLRWQEVFQGIDTVIAANRKFNQGDSSYIYKLYQGRSVAESRQKLFPFIWGTVARQGQLYGNRGLGNKVNNANPHWFSYPGYSELFTGYADPAINSNDYPNNPHTTLFDFLNRQKGIKGNIAAFGAWGAFDRILNEPRAGFPVVSAFDPTGGKNPNASERLLNNMLADSYKPWKEGECLDVFTHYAALEQLKARHPRVIYIGYGETDEWAHAGQYRSYLDAAQQVDKWIGEIWDFVQNDARYKNKTALLITVDHGRGQRNQWVDHGKDVPGAGETWFALMGPGIAAKGEVKQDMQLYQEQLAQTMAALMGMNFTAEHPVKEKVLIAK